MALYLHHTIPGVTVPEQILDRFEQAREDDYEELGVEIALDLIDRVKSKQGIQGLHLMSVGWESVVPRLLQESGLTPQH